MNGNMGDFSDDQLVKLAKQGNLEAFSELAGRFKQKIYNTILSFTKNHQDTDDLTQETFVHAFKSLKNFKQRSSFYTWFYRIAVNLTLTFLKKRSREKDRDVFSEDHSFRRSGEASNASPERYSLKMELTERLNKAIDSLPLLYKMSFILVVFQGMTHDQAASVLSCSENTVSWRMHKARKMLQTKLRPYLEEG